MPVNSIDINYKFENESDFIWGINGHPVVDKEYVESSLEQQLSFLTEHQFSIYRFDVNLNDEGLLFDNKVERFDSLLEMANKKNIQVFPVLKFYGSFLKQDTLTEQEIYQKAKRQGKNFAKKDSSRIRYYAIENELDLKTIAPNARGTSSKDYSVGNPEMVIASLKGMIDGIKGVSPEAQTIINYGGWYNWSFIDFLLENDVDFDILGCHWYSENGRRLFQLENHNINVLNELKRFNKPIWITEINKGNGSKYHTESEQAEMMNLFIDDLYKYPHVKAFFVYELYDMPYLRTQEWTNYEASDYGIIGWKSDPPVYSEYYYKPVSNVLKFRIEQAKNGIENYVISLYKDLIQQTPTDALVNHWVNEFKDQPNVETWIEMFLEHEKPTWTFFAKKNNSEEEKEEYIQSVYTRLLKRNPTIKEMKFWKKYIKNKDSLDVYKILLSSEEYWNQSIWDGYKRKQANN